MHTARLFRLHLSSNHLRLSALLTLSIRLHGTLLATLDMKMCHLCDADMSLWSMVPWRLILTFACECTSWRRLLKKGCAACPCSLQNVHSCLRHAVRCCTHEQYNGGVTAAMLYCVASTFLQASTKSFDRQSKPGHPATMLNGGSTVSHSSNDFQYGSASCRPFQVSWSSVQQCVHA